MAKRKIDCNLDDIAKEYLKKVKCEKTSKMFGTERFGGSNHSKSLKKFMKFLKQKEDKGEKSAEDDLGFEINFGAFQPETRLPSREARKPLAEKTNRESKNKTDKPKKDIPKEFIKKIKNLGMKVEDAEVLFKSKIDWTAVYSDNKIYCVEPGCDYFTRIDTEELRNHMIIVHKYGDYPCNYDYCDYVAYSKKGLKYHGAMMHEQMRHEANTNFGYKCVKPNCRSTFRSRRLLDNHTRIHNNELNSCQYCPYRYVYENHYGEHLNKHFRIKDYKCDECGLRFTTKNGLNEHFSMHEGITYNCLICRTHESKTKNSIRMHMRREHSDLLGKNINWDSVEKYVKLK